jgi:hypothetical protein
MNDENLSFDQSRRQFLSSLLPICSMSCFSLDGFQLVKQKNLDNENDEVLVACQL